MVQAVFALHAVAPAVVADGPEALVHGLAQLDTLVLHFVAEFDRAAEARAARPDRCRIPVGEEPFDRLKGCFQGSRGL